MSVLSPSEHDRKQLSFRSVTVYCIVDTYHLSAMLRVLNGRPLRRNRHWIYMVIKYVWLCELGALGSWGDYLQVTLINESSQYKFGASLGILPPPLKLYCIPVLLKSAPMPRSILKAVSFSHSDLHVPFSKVRVSCFLRVYTNIFGLLFAPRNWSICIVDVLYLFVSTNWQFGFPRNSLQQKSTDLRFGFYRWRSIT